jgi:hypothetical protein
MTKANGQTRHFGSFREFVDAPKASLATDSFYQATPVTSSSREI